MNLTTANAALERWNALDTAEAVREILPCCGSDGWAQAMVSRRPFGSAEELLAASDQVWRNLPEHEWNAAFESHPRIGQQHAHSATARSLEWSSAEQSAAMAAGQDAKAALADGNRRYEEKFRRIFIVCASGRPTEEILANLKQRMENTPQQELQEAAEQQRQITGLRLLRWLGVNS